MLSRSKQINLYFPARRNWRTFWILSVFQGGANESQASHRHSDNVFPSHFQHLMTKVIHCINGTIGTSIKGDYNCYVKLLYISRLKRNRFGKESCLEAVDGRMDGWMILWLDRNAFTLVRLKLRMVVGLEYWIKHSGTNVPEIIRQRQRGKCGNDYLCVVIMMQGFFFSKRFPVVSY